VVAAKLDRITRNVEFGAGLFSRSDVSFKVADMPHADNFQINIMLSVAQLEAEMISKRTIAALAAAKARGVQLGGAANSKPVADRAAAFAESLRATVEPLLALSSRRIAAALNERGIATADGGVWQSAQVIRLINRLKGDACVAA
jgi:DNA invertase Pin-like site-specific DNA recombinase